MDVRRRQWPPKTTFTADGQQEVSLWGPTSTEESHHSGQDGERTLTPCRERRIQAA